MNAYSLRRHGLRTCAIFAASAALGATAASPALAADPGKLVACPGDADSAMLSADEVEWPAMAYMRADEGGIAVVQIDIMENGVARNPRVVRSSGSSLLDQAAWRNVVRQRFAPRISACAPVPDSALVEVNFSR